MIVGASRTKKGVKSWKHGVNSGMHKTTLPVPRNAKNTHDCISI